MRPTWSFKARPALSLVGCCDGAPDTAANLLNGIALWLDGRAMVPQPESGQSVPKSGVPAARSESRSGWRPDPEE